MDKAEKTTDTRTNAQSARLDSGRITRTEARAAILLQLRKWREDGNDHIYFGALNIAPDLPEPITFGDLIDIAFDAGSVLPINRSAR